MISLRTLINTTIFWALALVVFWGYTKWIDTTPAKELIHAIWWSDLGNLTITTNEWFGITNETQLLQKIDNMEKMIQATNMTCSLIQLNNTTPNKALDTSTTQSSNTLPATTQQTMSIPVFNTILNNQLAPSQQATQQALSIIQRPIHNNPTISDIFQLIINPELTTLEQNQWYMNIFAGTNLSLWDYTLDNGILTLPLQGTQSLSSAQFQIISTIVEKTYQQFPEVNTVIVQQV